MTHYFEGTALASSGFSVPRSWRRVVEPQAPISAAISVDELAEFIEDPCAPEEGTARYQLLSEYAEMATRKIVEYTDREMEQRDIIVRFDAHARTHTARGGLSPSLSRFDLWLTLPRVPIAVFDRIETVDDNGVAETVDSASYEIDDVSEPARVHFHDPPTRSDLQFFAGIRVYYTAGYGADSVPADLRMAARTYAAYLFENRGVDSSGALRKSGALEMVEPFRVMTGL